MKKQIFGILLVLFLFFVIIKGQDLIIVLIFLDSTTLFSVCLFVVQVCVILQPVDGKKLWKVSFFSQNIVSDFLMKCPCGFRQAVTRVSRPISFLVTRQPS